MRLEKTDASTAVATELAAARPTVDPGPEMARTEPNESAPSPFAQLLRGLGREIDRGETLVGRATATGRDPTNLELLTLQAGVYRYSEAVDLAAKLVDRTASGVKTILQGQ